MIRTVIIDDEIYACEHLKDLLASYCPEIKIVGVAHDVASGIEIIEKQEPKLVLLDIQLPDGTGFDLIKKLDTVTFGVIFITGFSEFAIEAFKFSAIHYLLKPVEPNELILAIKRVEEGLFRENIESRLKSLFYNLQSNTNGSKKVVLNTSANLFVVNSEEIVMCHSEKNYTEFYLADGQKVTVSKTIKDYDELLSGYGFFRVHKQFLININHIKSFDKTGAGQVHMTGKNIAPVSARKRDQLLELFINL